MGSFKKGFYKKTKTFSVFINYDKSDGISDLFMECFWVEIVSGDLVLKEHEVAKWLTKEELYSVDWLPADLELIEKIEEKM